MKREDMPQVVVENSVEYDEGPTYIPPGGRLAGEKPIPESSVDERTVIGAVIGFLAGIIATLLYLGRI